MSRVFVVAVAALAVVGALAFGLGVSTTGQRDRAGYTPDLDRGAAIYAEACAVCHGADLAGAPDWRRPGPDGLLPAPPHDATGHTWHHTDSLLLDITTRGTAAVVGGGYESNMPGFGDVYAQDELRDVLEWIKTHWPDPVRAHQAQVSAQDAAMR